MTGVVVRFSSHVASTADLPGRGFTSFKTNGPLEYTRRCARDALIQASLEPEITSIDPGPRVNFGPPDTYFSFCVVTQNRSCAVALTDHTNSMSFSPPPGCDVAIAINRASVLAEPAKTAARTIWAHRETQVPALFSVRVMRRLRESPSGLRLGELEESLVHEPKNWVAYTLALACNGLVVIDYRSPITDDTMVVLNPTSHGRVREHWLG